VFPGADECALNPTGESCPFLDEWMPAVPMCDVMSLFISACPSISCVSATPITRRRVALAARDQSILNTLRDRGTHLPGCRGLWPSAIPFSWPGVGRAVPLNLIRVVYGSMMMRSPHHRSQLSSSTPLRLRRLPNSVNFGGKEADRGVLLERYVQRTVGKDFSFLPCLRNRNCFPLARTDATPCQR
jgi:hypothetical protein